MNPQSSLINIEKLQNCYIIQCIDEECQYKRMCANHISAGDYRTEGGIIPKLITYNDAVYCDTKLSHPIDYDLPSVTGYYPNKNKNLTEFLMINAVKWSDLDEQSIEYNI